jgi:hypothetical protein
MRACVHAEEVTTSLGAEPVGVVGHTFEIESTTCSSSWTSGLMLPAMPCCSLPPSPVAVDLAAAHGLVSAPPTCEVHVRREQLGHCMMHGARRRWLGSAYTRCWCGTAGASASLLGSRVVVVTLADGKTSVQPIAWLRPPIVQMHGTRALTSCRRELGATGPVRKSNSGGDDWQFGPRWVEPGYMFTCHCRRCRSAACSYQTAIMHHHARCRTDWAVRAP